MKIWLSFLFLGCLCLIAFAEDEPRVFTEQDLQKYSTKSGTPSTQAKENIIPESRQDLLRRKATLEKQLDESRYKQKAYEQEAKEADERIKASVLSHK
ncbi:MAG: hypothetical protein M0024_10635 [Nitrospiraceae bacterium]|nr:hypothetical protein [Nitrospiraceae bacterium]